MALFEFRKLVVVLLAVSLGLNAMMMWSPQPQPSKTSTGATTVEPPRKQAHAQDMSEPQLWVNSVQEEQYNEMLRSGVVETLSTECQDWIKNYKSYSSFTSQFGQDWFLFVNFFRGKRNGFFLDVGANSPRSLSNTFFFEKCLNWRGICVEADPFQAAQFNGTRSCTMENVCVSDNNEPLWFARKGYDGVLGSLVLPSTPNAIRVPCMTLDAILRKHGVTHVDFMSIDIEGSEINAFRGFPENVGIDVITMETFWSTSRLQWALSDLGYTRLTDIAMLDEVYVPRKTRLTLPSEQQAWREMNYQFLQTTQNGKCINGA